MVKGNEKLEIVTTQHPYSHEQLLSLILYKLFRTVWLDALSGRAA